MTENIENFWKTGKRNSGSIKDLHDYISLLESRIIDQEFYIIHLQKQLGI